MFIDLTILNRSFNNITSHASARFVPKRGTLLDFNISIRHFYLELGFYMPEIVIIVRELRINNICKDFITNYFMLFYCL